MLSLENATVLLAVATVILAVFAGSQAWATRQLAQASVMQLKALAPPSLHLALAKPAGVEITLTDQGRLTVGVYNLGQAEAHLQWVQVQVAGGWVHTEDRIIVPPGGKSHELSFSLTDEQAEHARTQKKVPIKARYRAEGTGQHHDWRAHFRYVPSKDRWVREGPSTTKHWGS